MHKGMKSVCVGGKAHLLGLEWRCLEAAGRAFRARRDVASERKEAEAMDVPTLAFLLSKGGPQRSTERQ